MRLAPASILRRSVRDRDARFSYYWCWLDRFTASLSHCFLGRGLRLLYYRHRRSGRKTLLPGSFLNSVGLGWCGGCPRSGTAEPLLAEVGQKPRQPLGRAQTDEDEGGDDQRDADERHRRERLDSPGVGMSRAHVPSSPGEGNAGGCRSGPKTCSARLAMCRMVFKKGSSSVVSAPMLHH